MARVALITGGARGIGLGIARELASHGWNLMLNGVRPAEQVEDVLEQLREFGNEVEYCSANIGVTADREKLIEATATRFGRLDALVNNAGITSPGRKDLLEADEASWDQVFDVNLKGPFFLTQLAVPLLNTEMESDRRSVVFISSISAEFVSVNRGDYCLSKNAMEMMTQLWAVRLAEFGVDVFEVRPGIIQSDMTKAVTAKYDDMIASGLTLERRWGTPTDVGKAVKALVSQDIPYATGQVLRIDGGMTIRSL